MRESEDGVQAAEDRELRTEDGEEASGIKVMADGFPAERRRTITRTRMII
jgi:hypothetical protein